MATKTEAKQALQQVRRTAKAKCKPDPQTYGPMSPGDFARQGDVYVTCIARVPRDAVKVTKPSRQVAEGKTQGSRHLVDDLSAVTQYRLAAPTVLDGPVIDAPRGFSLLHPEHGDMTFAPGVYQIGYQRQFAEELRRVRD